MSPVYDGGAHEKRFACITKILNFSFPVTGLCYKKEYTDSD